MFPQGFGAIGIAKACVPTHRRGEICMLKKDFAQISVAQIGLAKERTFAIGSFAFSVTEFAAKEYSMLGLGLG